MTDNLTKQNTPSTSSLAPEQNIGLEVNAANVISEDLPLHDNPYIKYIKTVQAGPQEDIKSFLARPTYIGKRLLTSASAADTDVDTFIFPDVLTGWYNAGTLTGGNTMIKNKLSGFLGIRFDLRFKVLINAMPFHQGLLMVRWLPFTQNQAFETAGYNYNLTSKTSNIRKVIIDLSCDTEVELIVPFTYPAPFLNLANYDIASYLNTGSIYITVYDPLAYGTGSTTSVELTYFASMENVELMGPIIPVAQSNRAVVKKSVMGNGDFEKEGEPSKTKAVFDAFGELAAQIPLISSFSGPLKWMGTMIDAPAKFFGFSAPLLQPPPKVVQGYERMYWNNCDQPRVGYSLGTFSNTEVIRDSGGYVDADEMTLSAITGRFAYIAKQSWTTADAANHKLGFSIFPYVAPGYLSTTATIGASSATIPTPVMFASIPFTYWRGDIIFRFRIVKTNFHSGRLVFVFQPGNTSLTSNFTNDISQYTYRTILDIREGNVFEITCPWVLPDMWNELYQPSGTWELHVLNELQAASTVSTSVTIIVEAAAGANFETAVPHEIAFAPLCPTAQSGACMITKSTAGGAMNVNDDFGPTAMCIGEKITSIRQLLLKANKLTFTSSAASGYFSFIPTVGWGYSHASSGGAIQKAAANTDTYSYFAGAYAMFRGSVNIGVLNTQGSTTSATGVCLVDYDNDVLYDTTTDYSTVANGNLSNTNFQMVSGGTTPFPVYNIPFYHRNPLSILRLYYSTASTSLPTDTRYTAHTRFWYKDRASAVTHTLLRSIGDDFQFVYFVATFPLRNTY